MRRKDQEIFVATFWSPAIGQIGYRGPAMALSSENGLGKFDILAGHTNFITLIFNRLTISTNEKKKIEYKFKRGVLEVSDNLVRVFLGI